MKHLAILLLCLPSCTMVGDGMEGTFEAAGVAGTAVLATPMVAIISWPAWHYIAARSTTALTGTVVPEREKRGGGLNIPDPTIGGDRMFWLFILAGAVILINTGIGVKLWANLKGRFRDDEAWDRDVYQPDIASLRAEIQALRKQLSLPPAEWPKPPAP